MPSVTDLLNDSLGQIGANTITAIDDGSHEANVCSALYPALLDSILRGHTWNFALTRVQLAQDAVAPVFGYTYAYSLPTDCLRIVEYNGALTAYGPRRYKIEGRKLLTNDTSAYIRYIARVTDPNVWDAMFYQCVACWLASKLADAIPHDTKKAESLLQRAEQVLLPNAMAVDSQEEPLQKIPSRSLTIGRNPLGRGDW